MILVICFLVGIWRMDLVLVLEEEGGNVLRT